MERFGRFLLVSFLVVGSALLVAWGPQYLRTGGGTITGSLTVDGTLDVAGISTMSSIIASGFIKAATTSFIATGSKTEASLKTRSASRIGEIWVDSTNNALVFSSGTSTGQFAGADGNTPAGW